MVQDYVAARITDNLDQLDSLVNDSDSLIASAAFHYYESVAGKEAATDFRNQWKPHVPEYELQTLVKVIEEPIIQLEQMPLLSFWISFKLTVSEKHPYLSRDDDPFYILDNPVKKDKVFRLPYVAPSSWKGALRNAMRYVCNLSPNDFDPENIERLFGTDKRRETESLRQGRLHFFPTFFSSIGRELINPHDRKNGAGTIPITLERAQGDGSFHLLYFPLDSESFDFSFADVADDLCSLAKALREMFTVYGFGAKTSSGFGIVEVIRNGLLQMRLDEVPPTKSVVIEPRPEKLNDFFTADNQLIEFTTAEMNTWGKPRKQNYEKAKKWAEKNQTVSLSEPESSQLPANPITKYEFLSWPGLIDKADELVKRLREKGRIKA